MRIDKPHHQQLEVFILRVRCEAQHCVLWLNVAVFFIACGAFGMGNGSVFQLLPQRFGKEIGLMTGLVGCGGGLGGFLLANMMGQSRQHTGSYLTGLLVFASLCLLALVGLSLVKRRWRTTWGALAQARI